MRKVILICWLICLSIGLIHGQSILAPSINPFQGSSANMIFAGGGINGSYQSTALYVSHGNVFILDKNTCGTIAPMISLKNEYELSSNLTGISYQWFLNEQAISGATESTYKATNSGRYAVQVGVSPGCLSAISTNIYVNILAIEEARAFAVWPNPASTSIRISYPSRFAENVKLEINDLLGRSVYSKSNYSNSEAIDIRGLNQGTYLIRLTSNMDERAIHMMKFLKIVND
jgi:hypothetical protein